MVEIFANAALIHEIRKNWDLVLYGISRFTIHYALNGVRLGHAQKKALPRFTMKLLYCCLQKVRLRLDLLVAKWYLFHHLILVNKVSHNNRIFH